MSSNANDPRPAEGWRERVHEVIFEADTRQGRIFDVVLMVSIVLSVITVSLESVDSIRSKYCLLYTSPSPRDTDLSRMPSSA